MFSKNGSCGISRSYSRWDHAGARAAFKGALACAGFQRLMRIVNASFLIYSVCISWAFGQPVEKPERTESTAAEAQGPGETSFANQTKSGTPGAIAKSERQVWLENLAQRSGASGYRNFDDLDFDTRMAFGIAAFEDPLAVEEVMIPLRPAAQLEKEERTKKAFLQAGQEEGFPDTPAGRARQVFREATRLAITDPDQFRRAFSAPPDEAKALRRERARQAILNSNQEVRRQYRNAEERDYEAVVRSAITEPESIGKNLLREQYEQKRQVLQSKLAPDNSNDSKDQKTSSNQGEKP